jgi:hypothetical protein
VPAGRSRVATASLHGSGPILSLVISASKLGIRTYRVEDLASQLRAVKIAHVVNRPQYDPFGVGEDRSPRVDQGRKIRHGNAAATGILTRAPPTLADDSAKLEAGYCNADG